VGKSEAEEQLKLIIEKATVVFWIFFAVRDFLQISHANRGARCSTTAADESSNENFRERLFLTILW
jgi:hypothetical protein